MIATWAEQVRPQPRRFANGGHNLSLYELLPLVGNDPLP